MIVLGLFSACSLLNPEKPPVEVVPPPENQAYEELQQQVSRLEEELTELRQQQSSQQKTIEAQSQKQQQDTQQQLVESEEKWNQNFSLMEQSVAESTKRMEVQIQTLKTSLEQMHSNPPAAVSPPVSISPKIPHPEKEVLAAPTKEDQNSVLPMSVAVKEKDLKDLPVVASSFISKESNSEKKGGSGGEKKNHYPQSQQQHWFQ